MRIIKLNAIDSTNNYLKDLGKSESLEDFTVVISSQQTKGRGQRGNSWVSEPHKNLTLSIFKKFSELHIKNQFDISQIVSVAIVEALLKIVDIPLYIKWPNDILAGDYKIGGILIENLVKTETITDSFIGIGINVNQEIFNGLPKASSLKLAIGKDLDLQRLQEEILLSIIGYFRKYENEGISNIQEEYYKHLYRMETSSKFQNPSGRIFSGKIKGVTSAGKLKVQLENQELKKFDLKEVKLIY